VAAAHADPRHGDDEVGIGAIHLAQKRVNLRRCLRNRCAYCRCHRMAWHLLCALGAAALVIGAKVKAAQGCRAADASPIASAAS
jgi:hypothetical protein